MSGNSDAWGYNVGLLYSVPDTRTDNPAQPPQVESLGWNNSVRGGFALDYRLSDELTLSSGIAYDTSPIPADRRQAFLPEANEVIYGVGATWNVATNGHVIASYDYNFERDASIQQIAQAAGTLRGSYSNRVQGLGLSVGARF